MMAPPMIMDYAWSPCSGPQTRWAFGSCGGEMYTPAGAAQVRFEVKPVVSASDSFAKEGLSHGIQYGRLPGHGVAGIMGITGRCYGMEARTKDSLRRWHDGGGGGGHCGHCYSPAVGKEGDLLHVLTRRLQAFSIVAAMMTMRYGRHCGIRLFMTVL